MSGNLISEQRGKRKVGQFHFPVCRRSAGVPLIIDTDASVDVDDVVAICMAHALMDKGEVDIKVEFDISNPKSRSILLLMLSGDCSRCWHPRGYWSHVCFESLLWQR